MNTIGKKLPAGAGAGADVPAPAPAPVPVPARSMRKDAAPVAPVDEPLALPRGAFLIVRKSGGLRFTSSETAVFSSGKVTRDGAAKKERLSAKQVARLRSLLAKSDLPAAVAAGGRHNPDGYAYEIVARIGRKVHSAEVFDGSVPEALKPLLAEVGKL
jgi:hypothetical protein